MSRDAFRKLSWDDLEGWVGNRALSKGRSYIKNVSQLNLTSSGGLIAWVQGTHRYATRVEYNDALAGDCSCPVGTNCKHCVAVVLHYLELLKKKKDVPLADNDDERFVLIENAGDDEYNDNSDENPVIPAQTNNQADLSLQNFLARQDKAKLEKLLLTFAQGNASVRKALEDQMQASKGVSTDFIKQVQRDVNKLSEFEWGDDYYRNESGPRVDLSRFKFRLKLMLDNSYYDDLVRMGQTILRNGQRLLEESHDDGELSGELQECMEVILSALPYSRLSKTEQLIYLVELDLINNYDLVYIDKELKNFWREKPSLEDWHGLAEYLQEKLDQSTPSDFSSKYRRDQLTDWLKIALENAGQKGDVLHLLEQEALKTQSYTRLVEELMRRNKLSEADSWIKQGIQATQKSAPGYASQLRDFWRKLREKEKNHLQLTALSAEDFFTAPSLDTFQKLRKDAQNVKLWERIEPLARTYLQQGKRPTYKNLGLPELDLPPQSEQRWGSAPYYKVLLDIALAEKKPDDVLHWYHASKKSQPSLHWRSHDEYDEDRIAEAIKTSHPEQAIKIWQDIAEGLIAQTSVTSYQNAAKYLRKLKPLLGKTWADYIAKLRETNKSKPRCVEILDGLSRRSILGE